MNEQTVNPFDVRMIFFRIGWMDKYRGITAGDAIKGGGSYVEEHGFGFEVFNFKPFDGNVYGWVMPGSSKRKPDPSSKLPTSLSGGEFANINLGRIGASSSDQSISDVIVVWVATAPEGGSYVVGWYSNATVYMQPQGAPEGSERSHADQIIGYVATALVSDAFLIPKDERVLQVPQRGKGNFGQANMWYADDQVNETHKSIRQAVLDSLKGRSSSARINEGSRGRARQHDVLKRQKVESSAIRVVSDYFTDIGYEVKSVESDNVGWDLEATLDYRKLRIEVKGLSGSGISVELTPNEYFKMKEHWDSYRLCVVTNALSDPSLTVFGFNAESGDWESDDGQVLNIAENTSARCSV